jgi:mannose-6-phosphate isomerase-like protein (cupin superfamily)
MISSFFTSPDHAPVLIQRLGVTVRLMSAAADSNGAFTLLDYTAPPGFAGPQPHYHKQTTELFYVLEGRLTVQVSDQTLVAGKNKLVRVPPGTMHTFSCTHHEPVRFLVWLTPGGMENYFRDLDELVKSSPVWPLPDMTPVTRLAEKYDTYS